MNLYNKPQSNSAILSENIAGFMKMSARLGRHTDCQRNGHSPAAISDLENRGSIVSFYFELSV